MITTKKGDSPMKRPIAIALALAVAIVLPVATAIAANGNGRGQVKSFTAKQCNELKRADSGAFKADFGDLSGEHMMRNCKRETSSEVIVEFKNAAKACAAERDSNPPASVEAFIVKYGANDQAQGKGAMRNAFGKCVSGKVRDEIAEDVDDFQTAAQQCRADRAADPEAFLGTWGTNVSNPENNASGNEKSKGAERKALGKCVSSTARGLEQEVEAPTPEEEEAPAV
jgi:hypothetical protein